MTADDAGGGLTAGGPATVESVAREIVLETVRRYRGVVAVVAVLFVVVTVAPTRSPNVIPFASDFGTRPASGLGPGVLPSDPAPTGGPAPDVELSPPGPPEIPPEGSTTTTTSSTTSTTSTSTSSTTTTTTPPPTSPEPDHSPADLLCDLLGLGC